MSMFVKKIVRIIFEACYSFKEFIMVIHLLVYLVEQHSWIATKRQVKMTGFLFM